MATFRFSRAIDLHWQGYDIKGPALTVFSIPDQLYEEFNADIAPVEPTLVWLDTNEFLTLSNAVSVTTLTGTIPISVTSTTSGRVVSISSSTNPAGYYLRANGTGATTWAALPADATGITNIIGTSPISAAVVGTTATISLNANYQTAGSYQPSGTYVTGVVGTSPISATGTTAITVSLNANYQTAGTYVNAVIGTSPASVLTASGTSTVSIVAGSINSTHLSATSVGSSQLIAQSVGTAAISSGAATSGSLLTSNGSGGATFAPAPAIGSYWIYDSAGPLAAASITSVPAGAYSVRNVGDQSVNVVISSTTTNVSVNGSILVSAFSSLGTTTTPDISSWSIATNDLSAFTNIKDFTYANSLYVAVGDLGEIYTSTNAISWTSRTSVFTTAPTIVNAIAYGNALWVAVGRFGTLATSTDAITWTTRTSGFGSSHIHDVAYGGTNWVAVGASGKLFTSADAITWTTRTSTFSTTDSTITSVSYVNSNFIIGGINLATTTTKIATSSAGTSWSSPTIPSSNTGVVFGTSFGSSLYCVTADPTYIITSPDLVTWTQRTKPSGTVQIGRTIYEGSRFLTLGNDTGTSDASYIVYSSDGITWSKGTARTNLQTLQFITYDGSKYLAISNKPGLEGVSTSTTALDVGGPINLLFDPIAYQAV